MKKYLIFISLLFAFNAFAYVNKVQDGRAPSYTINKSYSYDNGYWQYYYFAFHSKVVFKPTFDMIYKENGYSALSVGVGAGSRVNSGSYYYREPGATDLRVLIGVEGSADIQLDVYELKPPKKLGKTNYNVVGFDEWEGLVVFSEIFDYGDSKNQSYVVGDCSPFQRSGNSIIFNKSMVDPSSSGSKVIDIQLNTELGDVLTTVIITWGASKPCPNGPDCQIVRCPECNKTFCVVHWNHGTLKTTCVNGKEHVFCRSWKKGSPAPPSPSDPNYFCSSCNQQACQLCGHICPNKCSQECPKATCAKCGAVYCPTHDVHVCPNDNDKPNVPGTTHPDNDPPQSPPSTPPVDPEVTPPLTDPDKCTSECTFVTCPVCGYRYCPKHTNHTCPGATHIDPETGAVTTNPPAATGGDVPTYDPANPPADTGTGTGEDTEDPEDPQEVCPFCLSNPCICEDAPEAPDFDAGTGSPVDGVISKLEPSIDSSGLTKGEIDLNYYFQIPWTGFVFDVQITTMGNSMMAVALRTLRGVIRALSVLVFSFVFLFRLFKYINP